MLQAHGLTSQRLLATNVCDANAELSRQEHDSIRLGRGLTFEQSQDTDCDSVWEPRPRYSEDRYRYCSSGRATAKPKTAVGLPG